MDEFDYIVVGSGSAGGTVAARLSEDPNLTVCVLEAGGRDWNPFIHIPAGFMKTLVDPSVNWLYESEGSAGTAGRRIHAPRGKTMGGSSSINGNIYSRGQRMDFDGWAQRGNRGWGYADVLPYFKRSERRIGEGDETFRGRNGNLIITDIDYRHPLADDFIKGAVNYGIPLNDDYNGAVQEGISYTQRTIFKGRRVSSARAFLRPALKRPNIELRTKAHATKILFDGKRATGIQYRRGGQSVEIRARREIVLSGGSVNSPQLLQLSGVGPAGLLKDIGVPVHHELAGVGENLRDHFVLRMVARIKTMKTINQRVKGLPLMSEALKYFTGQPSVLGLSPTLVYIFWKSDPALDNGDLQISFTPASYKEGVQSQLDDFPGVTVAPWVQRPESIGYIRAKSADPFEAPAIQPNYFSHETDRRLSLAGMRIARDLMQTPEFAPHVEREELPGPDVNTEDEMLDYYCQNATTTFHLMGTCRMGPESDPTSVVDDQLRVRGLEGLRVADASIMPTMPSANTNAATIMIGEKCADYIRGQHLPPVDLASK
ncbi:MAG: GMC family oxidoreductase N-terminal domain-containing protein [Pseudomonadota bacterium]|nr:GMC family oxidoreductase N-terminal domain-containing protein [Pseudomonadota bacterium]MEC8699251.1 GMC family oxidoreductase N-terminal domain-containing protein [Pseudomonadota bacterium]MEE3093334.1 GMC family oxidoreductase N-terminal domain-containing protein [Pseudomonadota bacterium]